MPANLYLKCSFEFPDKLTVRAKDTFLRLLEESQKKYADADGRWSAIIANGVYFGAAINAGLLLNWKCESVPTLGETDLEQLDSDITDWAGPLIYEWFTRKRHIPKVSFLRRLTMAFARQRTPRPT